MVNAPTPASASPPALATAVLTTVAGALYLVYTCRNAILSTPEANGYKACTRCRYILTRLDPTGQCPECGESYDIEVNRVLWQCACRSSYAMRVCGLWRALRRRLTRPSQSPYPNAEQTADHDDA